ncbi:hypothetical protein V8F20_000468 [Naviculisporaceae sp. PSN 640]
MGFLFSHVCDLLQRLEDNLTARSGVRTYAQILREWFATYRGQFLAPDHDAAALLSTLLPEKRTDRVFLMKEKRLQTVIGRGLGLGRSRIFQLGRWTDSTSGLTLAECVELVLQETPNPKLPVDMQVTVEEIDSLLHQIASACRFSAPSVRRRSGGGDSNLADRELSLGDLYKRLAPRDAKWLTRLILKNFEPVVLDPQMVYRNYHPSLPSILQVQDDLTVAGRILAELRRNRSVVGRPDLAEYLKPTLGVKVGRQPWFKGRSIKHCLDMGHGRMSCEAKMDGEYCQIHIDLAKGRDCIQIFSKSGKDSTRDRFKLHEPIRQSLQLGKPTCPLEKGCILEGELVVWSDKDNKILDFHKIRKHVSRSGTFLGTEQDSQPHPWEHLMIVYYDVLMVDDESLLRVRQSERMERLKNLVTEIPGQSALVKRQIIDCDRPSARSDLRRAFAKCIANREEGLVLKADDPYFDFDTSRRPYSCCAIKLKKEYVGNFGDIGDFAVLGARLDAAKARTYGANRNIKWTHFYVGCLQNKEEVRRFKRKPRFVVTNVVELNVTQHETFAMFVNPRFVMPEENEEFDLRIEPGIDEGRRPSAIFMDPPVFDIRCFSFDKAGNTGFWSPRFPMVTKIHCDRTWLDTLSFSELQDMARKERELPPPEDSQEMLGWIAELEKADPKRAASIDFSSQATTASRTSTLITPTSPSASSTSQVQPRLSTPRPGAGRANSQIEVPSSPLEGPPAAPLNNQATEHDTTVVANSFVIPESQVKLNPTPKKEGTRGHRKRPSESQGSRPATSQSGSKSRKCSVDQTAATGPTASFLKQSFSSCSSNSQREPLADILPRSRRRNSILHSTLPPPRLVRADTMYQPTLEEKNIASGDDIPTASIHAQSQSQSFSASLSVSTSRRRVLEMDPSSTPTAPANTTNNNNSGKSTQPSAAEPTSSGANVQKQPTSSSTSTAGGGVCKFLPQTCTLQGYSILLSPCIADFPWVTEDLLSCHGITPSDWFRDPVEWDSGSVSVTSSAFPPSTVASTAASTRMTRKKMIILVDRRRKDATKAFLQTVVDAKLTRASGERRWVDVYDWRVLEDLRREEEKMGKRIAAGDFDAARVADNSAVRAIWRQRWIGLT